MTFTRPFFFAKQKREEFPQKEGIPLFSRVARSAYKAYAFAPRRGAKICVVPARSAGKGSPVWHNLCQTGEPF